MRVDEKPIPGELLRNRELTVAIAGNPNSGKTSLFNRLSGGRQHVGNYPGVTVEKKWGRLRGPAGPMHLVDLPGTYGLTAKSEEERVARRFLVEEKPDVVLDVLDASNLERNLYLAVQLMELELNLVFALNMIDVATSTGQLIDTGKAAELLGAPVVEAIAFRGSGTEEVKLALREQGNSNTKPRQVNYGEEIESEIASMEAILTGDLPFPRRYAAIKILEGDEEILATLLGVLPPEVDLLAAREAARARLGAKYHEPLPALIADKRYGFAAGLLREVLIRPARTDRVTQSERIDHVLTHRILGLPIFLGFMYLLFWLTFRLGDPLMGGMEALFGALGDSVAAAWSPSAVPWLRSLVLDGIIGGVGGVLVFLPNIVLLFLGISLMEDTGYMARAAFIMDRVMHRFGLHGKSFIPMLVGFGCTVPAIMATRTLESRRDRLITMLILPFISCGARLPIYLLLIPAFFPRAWHAPLLWGLYLLGVLLGLVVSRILRKTVFGGEEAPFVMELPPYRRPTALSIMIHMWDRSWLYLRKAGTIILAISILLWALMSFPQPKSHGVDAAAANLTEAQIETARRAENLEYSLAGRIGQGMQPLMAPMGFDWKISTAFLGAFAAKEVFVSQLAIVYSLSEGEQEEGGLREVLHRHYSPLQGLAILIFALLATPCMATLAITRREAGSWRWAWIQWFGLTGIGYLLATIVYQAGSLIGF